ncbi:hypothetical protein LguiA_032388 [Lonicera macranthoides]
MFFEFGSSFLVSFLDVQIQSGGSSVLLPLSWSPPSNGFFKINFVGATFRQNGDAGLWAVIRDSSVHFYQGTQLNFMATGLLKQLKQGWLLRLFGWL